MKKGIHPEYDIAEVVCACGSRFKVGSTKKTDIIKVEICSKCHPFYSGKQKIIDSGGRVDRFRKRFGDDALK